MIQYPEIDPVALSLGPFSIDWPLALSLGPISIYWYGLTYVGGLMFAWWLGRQRARVAGSPISEAQVDDLIFYAALGIIAGGRVGYALFYGSGSLLDDPARLFRLWEGGMSFHGGFLGDVFFFEEREGVFGNFSIFLNFLNLFLVGLLQFLVVRVGVFSRGQRRKR